MPERIIPVSLLSSMCALAALASGCIAADDPIPEEVEILEEEEMGTADGNQLPITRPGPSQTVPTGAVATLDGSESSDPEGASITFQWSWVEQPEGSNAAFADPSAAAATFTPDVAGVYVASLVVSDGEQASQPAEVRVTAIAQDDSNRAPIADAGVDRRVQVGESLTIDGSNSSDPDGDTLRYSWMLRATPDGSSAALSAANTPTVALMPDVVGVYEVRLVVSDGATSSNPATVRITAEEAPPQNQPPVARVGPDQNAEPGDTITLDGSLSQDPDGQPLMYEWTLMAPPQSSAALQDPTSAKPTFVPDIQGTYIGELTVSDGEFTSDAVAVLITVTRGNAAPQARAGLDRDVVLDEQVMLNGTGSSDPDGDALTYDWTLALPAGSAASLDDKTSATPTFTPDVTGEYVATLVVRDGQLASAPSSVVVRATDPCLVISEYLEGSSYNKALEVYNCGDEPLGLTSFGLCLVSNSSTTCSRTTGLGASVLPAGGTYILCNNQSNGAILSLCDAPTSVIDFNGNDRLMLFRDADADGNYDPSVDAVIDAFGETAAAPMGSDEWADQTLRRCGPPFTEYLGISTFDVTSLYIDAGVDQFSHLGTAPDGTMCP